MKKARAWTAAEDAIVRERYAADGPGAIGGRLGRSANAIKNRAQKLGLRGGRYFSQQDRDTLRRLYKRIPCEQIAAQLGRSVSGTYQAAWKMGLGTPVPMLARNPKFQAFIRQKHAAGWSDSEISAAWGAGASREWVGDVRVSLGLEKNGVTHPRFRQRVREKTAEQLRKAGLPSIGWLRAASFRQYQIGRGWLPDRCGVLGPRYVQVLDALWERGPQSRRELAAVIGMPWKGIRNSLTGNAEGGSILATLMRRGLVVCLGRIIRSPDCGRGNRAGQGHNTRMYSLPLDVERGSVTGHAPPPGLKKSIANTHHPEGGANEQQQRTA